MFKKSNVAGVEASENRVLGRILSREEVLRVSGGNGTSQPTDSWKDGGNCTPKSDPPTTHPVIE
ncbi:MULTISPECIES: hypothetical protein [Stenotrophomonas]|jgi:hypothetical protein|uniref:hypothetical protein n=1 Tax=Stenotrophomonas TaxID=40323 RepID=UPI000A853C2D|nr:MULTISPECIES: hypothetical protein [Stenotrophomonas]MPS42913.1 hypothetical protein [Stenotrophomonas sp.]ELC7363329.1 hypothetical protein [Stenotrophomonas maltophilia]MBH1630913.1 hypothetical protein [Stenotrophomonas maltophilia]MBN4989782.1 hypothetical protein [Stenotrophomonas maltophilia]MBN5020163.1 hypothetical protein [Stenotrophomonas maltophilia]